MVAELGVFTVRSSGLIHEMVTDLVAEVQLLALNEA